MSIELDISKTYDRVEWKFLEIIWSKLGFGGRWINKIMMCVKLVSFSMLINGEPKGTVIPLRGLRQGDPLSLYQFLLCMEGLITLLNKATEAKKISGIRICKGTPSINHLLFADDSILFLKANITKNQKVLELLETYENA